jgi:hypothetical protein
MFMKEKRTATRIQVNHPLVLHLEDDEVHGVLVDLSVSGALFIVEGAQQSKVDPDILGMDGWFIIKPRGKPARKYTGELVRFFTRDGKSYIALRFWQRYVELPSGEG